MRTLFLMHVGANTGYAIASLESVFLQVGLALGHGEGRAVHFAYRDFARGRPHFLPEGAPAIVHDFTDRSAENIAQLADYVADHRIDAVVAFDFEPIDPLVAAVKAAGVSAFIAYWGAPVTSAQPVWKAIAKRARFALAASKVDALVFESRALAEDAARYRGIPPGVSEVVPLGVRTDVFTPARSSYAHDVFGFDRHRRIVVYSGHMEPRKGVGVLVEAAVRLLRRRDDVAFLLCGNKPGEADAYERAVAAAGVREHVKFGGYRDDLPKIFPSCFAGAIASTGWDSFTYSSIEMASCGLPVVASRLQGLAEAVVDGETGILVRPGDPVALASAIESLLADEAKARAMGAAGRARVERELSVDAQVRRLAEVLRVRVLVSRQARRAALPRSVPARGRARAAG